MIRPLVLMARVVRVGPGDLPAPSETRDEARRRAEEILSRPELRPPPRNLLQRVLDELGELIQRALRAASPGSALVGWIVVAVVAVLVALVLFLVIRALQRDPSVPEGVAVDGVGRPPSQWRADAARHEAEGAWRDALRCHWRAIVADLAARGLVEEVPGRTTGEYRRLVDRAVPGAARSFAGATSLFEVAWYAADDIDERDVAEERRLGGEVMAEAAR